MGEARYATLLDLSHQVAERGHCSAMPNSHCPMKPRFRLLPRWPLSIEHFLLIISPTNMTVEEKGSQWQIANARCSMLNDARSNSSANSNGHRGSMPCQP